MGKEIGNVIKAGKVENGDEKKVENEKEKGRRADKGHIEVKE
jgi:hypothetical protein